MSTPAPWLLLHGWLGSAEDWSASIREALSAIAPVHSLRLPGHGMPCPDASDSAFEVTAHALWAQADALGVSDAWLVGYSMGGRLAYAMTAHSPARVQGLAVVGAHPGIAETLARTERRTADAARAAQLRAIGLADFLDTWYQLPLWGPLVTRPDYAALRARRAHGDVEALAAAATQLGLGRQPDFRAAIRDTGIPTRLLYGAHDARYAALLTAWAADAAPTVTAEAIPDAWHAAHLDQPGAVAKALVAFREHEGGR